MMQSKSLSNLPIALVIMRITIGLFLAPWVVEKFTQPETTAKIFAAFYFVDNLPLAASYGIGVLWAALLLAFLVGFQKRISYGLVMLFHGFGTLSTWRVLAPWLETHNHLFLAAIPTLGAMIALYLLRDHDTLLSLK